MILLEFLVQDSSELLVAIVKDCFEVNLKTEVVAKKLHSKVRFFTLIHPVEPRFEHMLHSEVE